jgi:hypothetical protein
VLQSDTNSLGYFWFLMVAFLSIKPGARLVPEWAVKKISPQTVI